MQRRQLLQSSRSGDSPTYGSRVKTHRVRSLVSYFSISTINPILLIYSRPQCYQVISGCWHGSGCKPQTFTNKPPLSLPWHIYLGDLCSNLRRRRTYAGKMVRDQLNACTAPLTPGLDKDRCRLRKLENRTAASLGSTFSFTLPFNKLIAARSDSDRLAFSSGSSKPYTYLFLLFIQLTGSTDPTGKNLTANFGKPVWPLLSYSLQVATLGTENVMRLYRNPCST